MSEQEELMQAYNTDNFQSLKKNDLVQFSVKETAKGFEGLNVIAVKTE
ncbi:MAG TPA: hypothetical protein VIK26_10570 [Clostridium sp.]